MMVHNGACKHTGSFHRKPTASLHHQGHLCLYQWLGIIAYTSKVRFVKGGEITALLVFRLAGLLFLFSCYWDNKRTKDNYVLTDILGGGIGWPHSRLASIHLYASAVEKRKDDECCQYLYSGSPKA